MSIIKGATLIKSILFNKNKKYVLFISLSILLFPNLSSAGKPDFPAPPDAAVETVANNMSVNGIKSDIRAFHTSDSIEEVVEFYRSEWKRPIKKGMPGFMETIDAAPWYIISRIEDDYLMTVQVQVKANDKSGSWGYLSISPLPEPDSRAPELGKTVPKISGSIVMNEMKHDDPGKKGTTTIISNTHSVKNNADYYQNHYRGKGWTEETNQRLGTDEGHSLVYKTRRDRVTIMILKDKHYTRVVLNSVKNTLF